MTYNKPEVALLGDAAVVIRGSKISNPVDSPTLSGPSAYELDEE